MVDVPAPAGPRPLKASDDEPAAFLLGGSGLAADLVQKSRAGCHFDIFRADRVSLTSMLFTGGDWRWRFCGPSGAVLAECEGYNDEITCRAAVVALQGEAGSATISLQN